MSKKNNNFKLIAVFVLLLAVVAITQFTDSKKSKRTFKTAFSALDTSAVSAIHLYPRVNGQQEIKLSKQGNEWQLNAQSINTQADQQSVQSMIQQLSTIKPLRLVANEREKWGQFEVNDSLGTRVKVIEGDKTSLELVIGKFAFNQQARSATTYVREGEDVDVYAVDGFLTMTFNQDASAYRNKTIIQGKPEEWTSIEISVDGSPVHSFSKSSGSWTDLSSPIDSNKVKAYINRLGSIVHSKFKDGYTPSNQPSMALSIKGNNGADIEVVAHSIDTATFAVNSSLNPEAWFEGGQTDLIDRLFPKAGEFSPELQ